jgi:four helix bundle protein
VWDLFSAKEDLSKGLVQDLDTASAGIVLNIAEGNGRFHKKDQRRFLGFAQDAAVKAATSLDMAVLEKGIETKEAEYAKSLLERITAMLFQMIGRDTYE